MTTLYTDHYFSDTSSVIDDIYYDAETQDMYVVLLNGAICGYENVRPEVYRAFAAQEDAGNSLGSYWNSYIKRGLTGKSTADVYEFVERESLIEKNETEFEDNKPVELIAQAPVEDESAPVQPNSEYSVEFQFTSKGEIYVSNITLFATSGDAAVTAFFSIVAIANYESVKVTAVTRFYN